MAKKCVHISTHEGRLWKRLRLAFGSSGRNLPGTSWRLRHQWPSPATGTRSVNYIPARCKRSEAERTALKEAGVRLQQVLTAEGISEEEILNDFKQWRAGGRK
jgi:hypothetical protein